MGRFRRFIGHTERSDFPASFPADFGFPRPPVPLLAMEALGPPRFLENPCACVPRSQTPVGRLHHATACSVPPVLLSGHSTPSATTGRVLSRLHHTTRRVPLLGAILDAPLVLLSLRWSRPLRLRFRTPRGDCGCARWACTPRRHRARACTWWGRGGAPLVVCGALAGLAGAYLAVEQHQFTAGMSAGRGPIAVTALVFGQWRPGRAWLGCLLFGFLESCKSACRAVAWACLPSWCNAAVPDDAGGAGRHRRAGHRTQRAGQSLEWLRQGSVDAVRSRG